MTKNIIKEGKQSPKMARIVPAEIHSGGVKRGQYFRSLTSYLQDIHMNPLGGSVLKLVRGQIRSTLLHPPYCLSFARDRAIYRATSRFASH